MSEPEKYLTQPERIAKLEVELGDAEDRIDHAEHVAAIAEFNEKAALARVAKLEAAAIDVATSLAAAISLLERGGKKAAPSDEIFEQMLVDYRNSLERTRATLFGDGFGEKT